MPLWIDIDFHKDDLPEIPRPKFDQEYAEQLYNDPDNNFTWEEITYMLSGTMDGACENPDGTINSMQTYCNILNYEE